MFTKKDIPYLILGLLAIVLTVVAVRCVCGNTLKEKMTDEHLVFFYADWCGYCKQFKPHVQEYKGIPIEYVDCTQPTEKERSLMKEYSVSGFPALFYKSETKVVTFNKPRTTQGIEEFVSECRSS
jgi:thiol-disulfide isomerase/thioredoxin